MTNRFSSPVLSSNDSFSSAESVSTTVAAFPLLLSTICAYATAIKTRIAKKRHGGSKKGRLRNRNLGRVWAEDRIKQDYFLKANQQNPQLGTTKGSVFNSEEFRRSFRVSHDTYIKLKLGVLSEDRFFHKKKDACDINGIATDNKILSALLQLGEGRTAYSTVNYCRISETVASNSLLRFCHAVVQHFGEEYLRRPNDNDLIDIESQFSKLGFPGCVGALDCASWVWDKCPVAEQGRYKGKESKPNVRMQVICDDRLRIWHLFFGMPGSRNDLTVLGMDPFFHDVKCGKWPSTKPNITLPNFSLEWYYWLTDQIYPNYKFFVQTIANPSSKKEQLFAKVQEGARKSVERVFANLFNRFNILKYPCRLWYKEDMSAVVGACCIIHNMVIEENNRNV